MVMLSFVKVLGTSEIMQVLKVGALFAKETTQFMKLRGKRVLVTGAGGFIGSHLCEALVAGGATVRAFVRYNSRNDRGLLEMLPDAVKGEIECVAGDLKDSEAIRRATRGCQVVFHLGALISIPYSYVHPLDYVQTNMVGSANVFNAALDLGVEKLVHTSTSEVYGTAQFVPISEVHPLGAQSPYAASKIGSDQLALSYHRSFDLPVTVLRPFNTFGPRQSARAVIPTIITQALTQDQVRLGALHPTRDLTYVKDTVGGFIRIAEADNTVGEVVSIGTGREVTIGELAEKITSMVGCSVGITVDQVRVRPEKSEVERLLCDNTKARQLMGWEPRYTLEAGLSETITWFREYGGRYKAHEYNV